MPEKNGTGPEMQLSIRHTGRIGQIGIFFGKFLRMFIYQNDWKMLPMAALIAGLVGFALGATFGVTREGTLTGVFTIVCVCIWNGSFNSVQVICREREVIKREHRSGMHISSYIMAHMMYQLLLCVLQTVISLFVLTQVGMKFQGEGLFTSWLIVDIGITMLLITYASDLLSLWISALVHNPTTAMTIMPFVLIFQLVFSGGLFPLPRIVDPITKLTVASPGLKAMASQVRANDLPYQTVSDMLYLVKNVEFGGTVTVGQVVDLMKNSENETVARLREIEVTKTMTVRQFFQVFLHDDAFLEIREQPLIDGLGITVGQVFTELLTVESLDSYMDNEIKLTMTFGEIVDQISGDPSFDSVRDEEITFSTTLDEAMKYMGRKKTKARIERAASKALYNPDYESTKVNVLINWIVLVLFCGIFAALSIITLEFVDRDKR
ncbi:MAG: ABC transporter permease [Eubacteriales bacterium]|nr:ABC transporter permease [Eubacteriales bacterium]